MKTTHPLRELAELLDSISIGLGVVDALRPFGPCGPPDFPQDGPDLLREIKAYSRQASALAQGIGTRLRFAMPRAGRFETQLREALARLDQWTDTTLAFAGVFEDGQACSAAILEIRPFLERAAFRLQNAAILPGEPEVSAAEAPDGQPALLSPAPEAQAPSQPMKLLLPPGPKVLTPFEAIVHRIILSQPENQAITSTALEDALATEGRDSSAKTIRTHVIPVLKQHYGLKSDGRRGYFYPPELKQMLISGA